MYLHNKNNMSHFCILIRKSKKHRYSFLINGFSGFRYYRATGYHFHLARNARNHVFGDNDMVTPTLTAVRC